MNAMLLLWLSREKHRAQGRSYNGAGSRTAALRGVHNSQPGR